MTIYFIRFLFSGLGFDTAAIMTFPNFIKIILPIIYYRFCKNAIFQNFGNICFSVGLLFFSFFFSRQLVEAIARPIYTKFGTNVSSHVRFRMHFRNLEKVKKTGHDEQKTSKLMKFRGVPSHFRSV